MNNAALFSSKTDLHETPQDFFDYYNNIWNFTLDVASNYRNGKCKKFFTQKDNGLIQRWAPHVCWMNPPYGREIPQWMQKAYEESTRGAVVVCLLPARVETQWWRDYCLRATHIEFIVHRLTFGKAESVAPFPSVVVTFAGGARAPQAQPSVSWRCFREDCGCV